MQGSNRTDYISGDILNVTDSAFNFAPFNSKERNSTGSLQDYLWLRCFDSVLTSIFFLIGLVGNSFIIYLFTKCPKLRKPQNVFIISLAITDLLIALPNPITAFASFKGYDVLGDILCDVTASVTTVGCLGSMINIAILAFIRYIIVIHPGVYNKYISWRVSITVCFLIQVYILLVVAPIWAGWSTFHYFAPMYLCIPAWQFNMHYTYFLFTMVFMLPGLLMAFCHFRIYRKYKRSQNKVRALRSQGIAGHISMNEFRLTLQLVLLFVIYSACWAPSILLTVFIDPHGKLPVPLCIVVREVTAINGIINIFVYFHFNRLFRTECMKYIDKYCKCCLKLKLCHKQEFPESASSDLKNGVPSTVVKVSTGHSSSSSELLCLQPNNPLNRSATISDLTLDNLNTIPEVDI